MIISVTERGMFKRCRRQWYFGSFNRMGIEPVVNKPALVLGSLIHQTMAAWTEQPEMDPEPFFWGKADETVQRIKDNYKSKVGAPISEVELQDTYDALHLGHVMTQRYRLRYGSAIPEGYRMVQVEQTCLVSIPDTEHWECANSHTMEGSKNRNLHMQDNDGSFPCPSCDELMRYVPHYLEGTLDGLLEDAHGALWVLERKTYANRPNEGKLKMEDQFLAYDWMLTQLFPDRRIGGILYDGMWKRDDGKKLDECFQRYYIIRDPHELQEFGEHLTLEALDMASSPRIYTNRRWEGCTDCIFEKLCTAISRDEDAAYVLETYYQPRKSGVRVEVVE